MKKTKQTIASILLTSLLLSTLAYTFVVRPVGASGIIYIRSDGSVDPPGAPILRNGDLYTLTNSTSSSIIVERDNIIVDGVDYTVQGSTIGNGIYLNGRSNVTIRNINVRGFESGVYISATSRSTILASNITDNDEGISSYESSNNTISGNSISTNVYEGIYLYSSSNNNTICGNSISANVYDGIYLFSSSDNSISGNNILGNGYGISPYYSSSNRIFLNNFINNTFQVNPNSPLDMWDNGYPSGGNYWSDYNGTDFYNGPYQNMTGSDGMGDTPYMIGADNQDHYPLVKPFPWDQHDMGITSLSVSKTVVGQGYTSNVSIMMFNYGQDTEIFNVTAYANETLPIDTVSIELTGRTSTTVNFTWNTPGFAKGNYTVWAYAWPVLGETETADNTFVDGLVIVSIVGDVNGDGRVDLKDVLAVALAYGSYPGHPKYSPNLDINDDDKIDLKDYLATVLNYGKP